MSRRILLNPPGRGFDFSTAAARGLKRGSTFAKNRSRSRKHAPVSFSSISHTETVVAVQELARFRRNALPSHFLLNCAITCAGKGKCHYAQLLRKGRNGHFPAAETYLAVAKAEKYRHTETLEEGGKDCVLFRYSRSGKTLSLPEETLVDFIAICFSHKARRNFRATFKYNRKTRRVYLHCAILRDREITESKIHTASMEVSRAS